MGDRGEVLLGSRGELKLKCIATEIYTMLSQDLLPCTARRRQLGVRWLRWLPHSVTGTCAAEFAVLEYRLCAFIHTIFGASADR